MNTEADLETLVKALGKGRVLENYILPGMRSTLLGSTAAGGKLRLFEMQREQEYEVTAHDHRYAFQCCVLAGWVKNRRYRVQETRQEYAGYVSLPYNAEAHTLAEDSPTWLLGWITDETFGTGDWYSMRSDEFHSIRFANGAKVLFIEGPPEKPGSSCLLPYHNGRICNTFIWRDWMMQPTGDVERNP